MSKLSYKISFKMQHFSFFFLLDVNFDKFIIILHFLFISPTLVKFLKN